MNALKNTASSLFGAKRLGSPWMAATLLGAALMSGCGDDGSHCDADTYWETHECDEFVESCNCYIYVPGNPIPTEAYEPDDWEIENQDITNKCLGDHSSSCDAACAGYGGLIGWDPVTHSCNHSTAIASCTGWSPSTYIVASGGTRTFFGTLLSNLQSDPTPLYACDTARIAYSTGTGYVVEDASSTDAVYLAGLRNGDELVSVNGYPITTPAELAYAYLRLWYLSDESPFTVIVDRGGTPTTLLWYVAWV